MVFETAKFFGCLVGQFNAKAVNFPVLNSYFFSFIGASDEGEAGWPLSPHFFAK